jgi:hypothetical protein
MPRRVERVTRESALIGTVMAIADYRLMTTD